MSDFFRFWWGLLYWNSRKLGFVLRRRRGRCPCQCPSDSGRAWETTCDAAVSWNRPERFRRVCPDFRIGPSGWRCAVNTAAVRPYWRRAAACFGGAAAGLYLSAALAFFVLLRATGCEGLTPVDTIWPGRWPRIAMARSQHYVSQAQQALRNGDTRRVLLNLGNASDLAPTDYGLQLSLAQIYQHLSNYAWADQAFVRLWVQFPAQREKTAITWHDGLVATRRYELLGRVAFLRLTDTAGPQRQVWLRVLFVALRGAAAPKKIVEANSALFRTLPPLWQSAIAAEADVRGGDAAALQRWPELAVSPENSTLLILRAESFVDAAPAREALTYVSHLSSVIGAFEYQRLLYRLHSRAGEPRIALAAFDGMLRSAGRPLQRERLLAVLVEFPSAGCIARLSPAVENSQRPFSQSELAGLWSAAVASGNDQMRDLVERRMRANGMGLDAPLSREFSAAGTALWMRVLPIEREMAYALSLRFARK